MQRKDNILNQLEPTNGEFIVTAKTGSVTLIQRFGGALNLNIHLHMLFMDGVYEVDSDVGIGKFYAIETLSQGRHWKSGRV